MAKYLSARVLGISEHERRSLLALAIMLKDGVIPEEQFQMNVWFERNLTDVGCGSVGCIGGWCDFLFNTKFVRGDVPVKLDDLFFYFPKKVPNRKQIASAIELFLQKGNAFSWDLVA